MHLVLIVIVKYLTAGKEEKKMPVQINHWDFEYFHFSKNCLP